MKREPSHLLQVSIPSSWFKYVDDTWVKKLSQHTSTVLKNTSSSPEKMKQKADGLSNPLKTQGQGDTYQNSREERGAGTSQGSSQKMQLLGLGLHKITNMLMVHKGLQIIKLWLQLFPR